MIDIKTYLKGESNDIVIMDISGRADMAAMQVLVDCVEDHLADGWDLIVLDCSGLRYMSSMGLAALVRLNSRVQSVGGMLALVGLPGLFAEMIRIVGLDQLLRIFPTVENATESLGYRILTC